MNQHAWFLISMAVLLVSCRSSRHIQDPESARVGLAMHQAWHHPAPAEAAVSPVAEALAGPHPVEVYIRHALAQNPQVHAARKRVDAAAMRVPQAASLKDPMLDVNTWPIFPAVPQVAAGRMTVELMVSQEVPWFGKLRAQAAAAEREVLAARAELAAVELRIIEAVKLAYYDLYYAQQALRTAQADRAALADVLEVANVLYQTNRTSQQDVLRLQAELANVDGELVRLRQMHAAAAADLAQVLHVSPDTPVAAVEALPPEEVPQDLQRLYELAVAARPELHALWAEIARGRHVLERKRLDYYPDATLAVGWTEMTTRRALAPTSDGIDMLAFGLRVNLPLYRQRLHAAVREAEAEVVSSARQYDALKDETQRDVKRLFTQAASQQELERLLRERIIPSSEQAFEVAMREYQVGEVEFADLMAAWRDQLRYHLAHAQLEAQLRQTLAQLERVVGGWRTATESVEQPGQQLGADLVPAQQAPVQNLRVQEVGGR